MKKVILGFAAICVIFAVVNACAYSVVKLPSPTQPWLDRLRANPDDSHARFRLAKEYEYQKAWPKAEAQWQYLLQKNPNVGYFHYNLGKVLKHEGKMREAQAEWKKVLVCKDNGFRIKASEELRNSSNMKT